MAQYDLDFFVLGAGSGGVRAARIAGGHGARVAVAEVAALGGTCVNVGCVPKKLLSYAADIGRSRMDGAGFGWTHEAGRFDWPTLIENKNAEILRLNGIYRRLLENAGVRILEGQARLLDDHTVEVAGERLTAERILIAVGGWPRPLNIPGAELAITSNEAFFLEALPERVLIVGGGYVAVEFAGIFSGMGAHVTQVHRGLTFLSGFDADLGTHLAGQMKNAGIDLRLRTMPTAIERVGKRLRVSLSEGEPLEVDQVLAAIGRVPRTAGLGLEAAGVALARSGAVLIDEEYRTSVPHIFAIGDVTDRHNLTPVATAEGHALADNLFGRTERKVDYHFIPTAVFSPPPIGTVGLSEQEARERQIAVACYKTEFLPMKHQLSGRHVRTLMKLIVERATDRVIGLHMVGDDAPEIVQGFAVALNAGATKADFDRTIGIHPTAAEEFVTMRNPVPDAMHHAPARSPHDPRAMARDAAMAEG